MKPLDRLIRYGVSTDLAEKAHAAGLTATNARSLAKRDLVTRFGLTAEEAAELKKCLVRQAIDPDTVDILLDRNNHTCCICKGTKSGAIIIHHIEAYEVGQNNEYSNLAVLCPADHDRAHRPGGLSLGLTENEVLKAKRKWEDHVELANAQAAAKIIRVVDEAIDYVNVMRIEDMCIKRFGRVPETTISPYLKRKGILDTDGRFDEAYVRKHLSNGKYLFDYINSSETEHYRQLLEQLSPHLAFEDLSDAAKSGIRRLSALEGKYAFFIGGVRSKQPSVPVTRKSPPIVFTHKTKKVRISWHGDPNYLSSMSAIARQGSQNRYIVYGLVRTVAKADEGAIEVIASPLLIAQPTKWVDRTPAIHWQKYWSGPDDFEDDDL